MRYFLSTIILNLFVFYSLAQNWTGNVNSDWNNSANWSAWPLNGADLTIDPLFYTGAAASPVVSANSTFSPGLITVSGGGDLTIAGNLTTQDDVEVFGIGSSLTVNAGTFSVNPSNGGRLIIDLGATMLLQNGNVQVGERFIAGQDALITINGGSASSGDRLLMDLGGRIIQNAGTVSTAAVFAMADGSPTQASGYVLNAGTLNITGEMAFENEFGIHEPTFLQNGGTLTLNGNMFWFGIAPGGGRPRFIQSSGTANINGLIDNMVGSTVDLYLELNNNATFNYNGSAINLLHTSDSIVKSGNAILNLNTNSTLTNPGVFYATGGNTNVNGTSTLAGNGSFQFHHLHIAGTGVFNQIIPTQIKIGGNWTKLGTFNGGQNTVVLNGNQLQSIGGSGIINLHHLVLDHTSIAGIDLQIETVVNGSLTLNSGKLTTYIAFPFRIADNATSSSGNALSFVNGPITKHGNDAFVFPTGKNDRWRRIAMTAPQSTTSVVRATYFDQSYSTLVPFNAPLSAVSNLEYWNLEELVEAGSLSFELFWEDASTSAILNCPDLTAARWNGSSWDNVLSNVTGVCSGAGAGSVSSVSSLPETGIVTFGFYDGVTTQNLSICSGNSVTVGTNTYTTTGVYIDVLQDINLQDSVVITNLTVSTLFSVVVPIGPNLTSASTDQDSYQWVLCPGNQLILGADQAIYTPVSNGTYSLITTVNGCTATSDCIDVTIQDTTICNGESVQVGTNTYSATGNYTDLLVGISLQDSLIVTNLNVFTVNPSVNQTGLTLNAVETTADQYQWIDCNNGNQPIPGAISSEYTVTVNGSYAVEISLNGCTIVSNCITISNVGLDELSNQIFSVFPNPSNGTFTLNSTNNTESKIQVVTMQGQLVEESYFSGVQHQFDLKHLSNGTYFLRLENSDRTEYLKIIIEN